MRYLPYLGEICDKVGRNIGYSSRVRQRVEVERDLPTYPRMYIYDPGSPTVDVDLVFPPPQCEKGEKSPEDSV